MTLWQIIVLCWQHVSRWAAAHPGKAVLACIGITVGSSVTAQRLELPIWRWARDWINKRLDGLGKRLNASLSATIAEQGQKIATLETVVGQLLEAQAKAEATADRRRADDHRQEILRFNLALVGGSKPDRESYVEILGRIDRYNRYCDDHPEYQNSRADAAIQNIRIHYNNRLKVGFNQEV
jgi:hypothetical protein